MRLSEKIVGFFLFLTIPSLIGFIIYKEMHRFNKPSLSQQFHQAKELSRGCAEMKHEIAEFQISPIPQAVAEFKSKCEESGMWK